jgi:hypothetical protein
MFIGHFAVGFAGKKWAPKTSLGTLFAAAVWLDLVWPLFVMLDLEHVRVSPGITKFSPFDFYDFPLSHSLGMALAWAVGFGLVYFLMEEDSRGALVLGGLVASHWFLDLIVHRADLPLLPAPGGRLVGWDLWDHPVATVLLESGMFLAGFWIYLKATKALDPIGRLGIWFFAAFLAAFYVMSFTVTAPTNPQLIASAGAFSQILILGLAYWIDGHRKPVKN